MYAVEVGKLFFTYLGHFPLYHSSLFGPNPTHFHPDFAAARLLCANSRGHYRCVVHHDQPFRRGQRQNLVKEISRLQQAAVFTEEVLGQRLYHRPLSWGNPPDQNIGEYSTKRKPPTLICAIGTRAPRQRLGQQKFEARRITAGGRPRITRVVYCRQTKTDKRAAYAVDDHRRPSLAD